MRINLCLCRDNIKKIENELIKQGKNPNKKKSEFLRGLITHYDTGQLYFDELQVRVLTSKFADIVRIGGLLNRLVYTLENENVEFVNEKGEISSDIEVQEVLDMCKGLKTEVDKLTKVLMDFIRDRVILD